MTLFKTFKAAAFALAFAGLGLVAPNADADTTKCRTSDHYQREYDSGKQYDRGHYSRDRHTSRSYSRHGDDGFSFSVRLGSSDRHSSRHVSYSSNRHYDYDRGYDRGYSRHYDRGHYSRGHYDGYTSTRTYTRSNCDIQPVRKVVVTSNHGYWKRVYVPAVYETRYYRCGTPYRVCIRASYYKRVWVSGSRCY